MKNFFKVAFLLSLSVGAAEQNSAQVAKKIVENYFTIVRDPNIARGNYAELFKLKQLSGMSAADRGWVTRSIIRFGVKDNIKWSLSGSVLKLSLPEVKTGMLEIDFRDVVKGPDRILYFNGKKYVSRYLAQSGGDRRFGLKDELNALKKFFTTTQLGMHPWLYEAIKVAMFPLTMLAGCDDEEASNASAALAVEGAQAALAPDGRPLPGGGNGAELHDGVVSHEAAEAAARIQVPGETGGPLPHSEASGQPAGATLPHVAATLTPDKKCAGEVPTAPPLTDEDLKKFMAHSAEFEFDGKALDFEKAPPEQLTEWDSTEPFPSLGLGHYTWYPAAAAPESKTIHESFPEYIEFMVKECKIAIPSDLTTPTKYQRVVLEMKEGKLVNGAPWADKANFDSLKGTRESPKDSGLMALTKFLWTKDNFACQTKFQQKRLADAIAKIWSRPAGDPGMCTIIKDLMASPPSYLAMLDYVNFKGDGTDPNKDFYGRTPPATNIQWGLKQVIETIRGGINPDINESPCENGEPAHACFAKAAEAVLNFRVKHAMVKDSSGAWVESDSEKAKFEKYLKRPKEAEIKAADPKNKPKPGGWARRIDAYKAGI